MTVTAPAGMKYSPHAASVDDHLCSSSGSPCVPNPPNRACDWILTGKQPRRGRSWRAGRKHNRRKFGQKLQFLQQGLSIFALTCQIPSSPSSSVIVSVAPASVLLQDP
eukprot:757780-Hanusia_phi.AAC.3